jgi:hypothetical protein
MAVYATEDKTKIVSITDKRYFPISCLSPPQKPENKRDEDTQDYACYEREIEGEVLPLDNDVSRELAKPGDLP